MVLCSTGSRALSESILYFLGCGLLFHWPKSPLRIYSVFLRLRFLFYWQRSALRIYSVFFRLWFSVPLTEETPQNLFFISWAVVFCSTGRRAPSESMLYFLGCGFLFHWQKRPLRMYSVFFRLWFSVLLAEEPLRIYCVFLRLWFSVPLMEEASQNLFCIS